MMRRRLILGVGAILVLSLIGAFGYMLLEGWSFPDAIY